MVEVRMIGYVVYHWSTFDTRKKVYKTSSEAYKAAQNQCLRVAILGSDDLLYRDEACTDWVPYLGSVSNGAVKHSGTLSW